MPVVAGRVPPRLDASIRPVLDADPLRDGRGQQFRRRGHRRKPFLYRAEPAHLATPLRPDSRETSLSAGSTALAGHAPMSFAGLRDHYRHE